LKCERNEKYGKGGGKETSFIVETKGSEINSVTYSGMFYSGQEGGAYTCDLEATLTDGKTKWTKSGDVVTITLKPESADQDSQESTIRIKLGPKSFNAEFNVAPMGFCGFGAEFPRTMKLSPSGKCKVKF